MKLQRSTLILVATALLLGGVVLIVETRQSSRPTATQGEAASPLYPFEEADVVGLHIETPSQEVTFRRDQDGFWQMTNPEAHPAEEAAIAFLLSRLTTDGLVSTTTADAANQSEFGLDVPFATVTVRLQDDTQHRLVLGGADFSGQNAYALVDPETIPMAADAGEMTVSVVSEDILNGVSRPLEEWKATIELEETDGTAGTEELENNGIEVPDGDTPDTAAEEVETVPEAEDESENLDPVTPETDPALPEPEALEPPAEE